MLGENTKRKLWKYGKDLYEIDSISEEIAAYTGESEMEVWKRLAKELDSSGTNVIAEAKRFDVTPFVFDQHLLKFYQESDGFIYETCVESRNPYRLTKWLAITEFMAQTSPSPSKRDVLLYGDSVGNDSIFLKRMGFRVFYHDYDGYCSRFAKERFKNRNLEIESFTPGTQKEFDYVICFEVAEHVPDPPALIEELATLTSKSGFCIFSESFGLVRPQWPTHLASNLQYVGKSDAMFRKNCMKVVWKDIDEKPTVYAKGRIAVRKRIRLQLNKLRMRLQRLFR